MNVNKAIKEYYVKAAEKKMIISTISMELNALNV